MDAERRSPELPLEIIFLIMEQLLVERDKASHRSAAYLAQTCTFLRNSEVGQKARYFHALARRSMSVTGLPLNFAHEAKVLEESDWPCGPPRCLPCQDTRIEEVDKSLRPKREPRSTPDRYREEHFATPSRNVAWAEEVTNTAWDAVLRGDKVITLTYSRKKLHCFVTRPDSHFYEPQDRDKSTQHQRAHLHTVIRLAFRADEIAVDSQAKFCLVRYETKEEGCVKYDVISLETGGPALPEGRARLSLSDNGNAAFNASSFMIEGDYVAFRDTDDCNAEVRLWNSSTADPESHFPVVWSGPLGMESVLNNIDSVWSLSLLAPNFFAVQWGDGQGRVASDFFRLDGKSTTHVAGFLFPPSSFDNDPTGHESVVAGAAIAPGEEGLVVIQSGGCLWLLELALLVSIVYARSADLTEDVPVFDVLWVQRHMKRLTPPVVEDWPRWYFAVSGWRCAFLVNSSIETIPTLSHIRFLDASPRQCLTCTSTEPSLVACFRWGDRFPMMWQNEIEAYLPPAVRQVDPEHFAIDLYGGRLLLYCLPEGGVDWSGAWTDFPKPYLRLWRT